MKPKKYYWKVVSKTGSKTTFSSAVVYDKASIDYEIGKVSHHKFNNGIFCFQTREQARNLKWFHGGKPLVILKVENVGNIIPRPIYANISRLSFGLTFYPISYMDFPKGTIAFSAIKPIEIVR